jgi:hypothetical protein
MPHLVTIPMSYFEAQIQFERPNLRLWLDRTDVTQALFDAFAKWGVNVDNVELISTGKPSEQGIKFMLPQKKASFFFSPASCAFTRDGTSWDTVGETTEIFDTALSTLVKTGNVKPANFNTIVALHLQPKDVSFRELLQKLIPQPMVGLEPTPPRTLASLVKWDNRRVTVDGSAHIANGIYVKLERTFGADASYEQIAHQLKADEDAIFAMLDVKEEA